MVQIPTYQSKSGIRQIGGVPTPVSDVTSAATLPYRSISQEAKRMQDIATRFAQEDASIKNNLDKLQKEKKLADTRITEKYKTDLFKLNENLKTEFEIRQLNLDRKTLLKTKLNSILPQLNQIKLEASSNPDTIKAKKTYDDAFKKIITSTANSIDDDVVKQMFQMDIDDIYATQSQEVDRFIRQNSIANAQTVLQTEKQNLFQEYLLNPQTRVTTEKKLFSLDRDAPGIFLEASIDGILSELPSDAVNTARKELYTILANQMVEENPKQFLSSLERGSFKGLLDVNDIPGLIKTATDNARSQDVDFLLTFNPIDTEKTLEEHDELYIEATKGNFYGNEEYQNIYKNLDQEGKNNYIDSLERRRNQIQSEITWKRSNDNFLEVQQNDEVFVDSYNKIVTGDMGINDIDQLQLEGKYGISLRESLKGLVEKKENGLLPSNGNLGLYNKLFDKVVTGEIQSLEDKIIIDGYSEPVSILDLTGGLNGIGTDQTQNLYSLIISKNNKGFVENEKRFQEFLTANKEKILGNPVFQKYNTQSESRFFDFSLIMRQAYESGITDGKSSFNLLNSNSKDFILKNIQDFLPTNEQLQKELIQSIGVESETEINENPPPQRKENQSIEEYENSKEYLDWLSKE